MSDAAGDDERWLDAALSRVLVPPRLPPEFRQRLQAALAHAESQGQGAARAQAARAQAEREQQERLAALDANYVRLQRRTLGTLLGGSFAAGAVVALAMPWLQATFGFHAPLVLAIAGAVAGLGIAVRSWRPRDLLTDLTWLG